MSTVCLNNNNSCEYFMNVKNKQTGLHYLCVSMYACVQIKRFHV